MLLKLYAIGLMFGLFAIIISLKSAIYYGGLFTQYLAAKWWRDSIINLGCCIVAVFIACGAFYSTWFKFLLEFIP